MSAGRLQTAPGHPTPQEQGARRLLRWPPSGPVQVVGEPSLGRATTDPGRTLADHVKVANAEGMHALARHVIDDLGVREAVFVSGPSDTPTTASVTTDFGRRSPRAGSTPSHCPSSTATSPASGAARWRTRFWRRGRRRARSCVRTTRRRSESSMSSRRAGVRVPQDTIVTGFDGIEEGRLSTPRLTTVQQPMADLGRAAF